MFDTGQVKTPEFVVLAGVHLSRQELSLFEEDMSEMATLCDTAGTIVVDVITQRAQKPVAATYFGKGKIQQIKECMLENNCKTVVIDAELKPSQIQNIEAIIEGKVIDRSQLILDIFSLHAKTNEAKIQVELAQLEVLYPRLTKMWGHLSRQVGGVGTRGPGETQLETDRRLVQKKITHLKQRLKKIEHARKTQRKGRDDAFHCSLVGYTNVGKSTILNAISGSDVLVENKLFATLDTSTRKTFIPGAGEVVISDTVGFLRKLPHDLVASFRSTLEIAIEADLLIIVMDASSKWHRQQMDTVRDVLGDLEVNDKPVMILFNKVDLVEDAAIIKEISELYPKVYFTSAYSKERIKEFKQLLSEEIIDLKRGAKREDFLTQITPRTILVG